MSSYNPPIENVPIFDSSLFRDTNSEGTLTITQADKRYLKFPIAQGNETLQGAVVQGALTANGTSTFNSNVVIGSAGTTNLTPTLTTNKTALILGSGGNGKLDIECPVNIGGFGSLNLTTADINMNGDSYINQGATNTTANNLGLTNMAKPLSMNGGTSTDRTINNIFYQLQDANSIASLQGQIYAGSGVFNYDNDTNGGSHNFATNTAGGVQTIPLNFSSVDMTIQTTNPPTQTATQPASNDSSTKIPTTAWVQGAISSSVSSAVPVGSTIAWGGNTTAPAGWLFCQGQGVSTTTYSALFAVIGYTYGGSGATFNLPTMISNNSNIGVFPAGSAFTTNTGFRVDGGASNIVYPLRISSVGFQTQEIAVNQLPPHTHTLTFPTTQYVNDVNTTNNTSVGGSSTRAVSDSKSNFPTATNTQNYGNLQGQAEYTPIYTAFTWIIKF